MGRKGSFFFSKQNLLNNAHAPTAVIKSAKLCFKGIFDFKKKKRKKHNSKRAGRGKGGRLVCSFVIIMQQGLPNLFPKQSKMIFLLLHRISTQSQRMCTYAVGASCWAGGWRGGESVGEHG